MNGTFHKLITTKRVCCVVARRRGGADETRLSWPKGTETRAGAPGAESNPILLCEQRMGSLPETRWIRHFTFSQTVRKPLPHTSASNCLQFPRVIVWPHWLAGTKRREKRRRRRKKIKGVANFTHVRHPEPEGWTDVGKHAEGLF